MASNKIPAADRSHGGPGQSERDATEPVHAPPKTPAPGTPTNPRRSRVSGGGGERDSHHTHNPADKKTKSPR
ncbi:MAG: hypothetical protein ACM3JG_07185 [Thiohalocapsa sp.]